METRPGKAPAGPAPIRFAANGDVSLAYQVVGDGPLAVLLVTGWVLSMESVWEDPAYVRFVERLADGARVILWDKRGTGMSDRVPVDRLPTLEERMDDLRAVLDAAGADEAAIVGLSEGAVLAAVFGAVHPDRCSALVLYGGWAKTIGDESNPWMADAERFERFAVNVRDSWDDMGDYLRLWAPSVRDDPVARRWWTRALHRGASPASAVAWLRMLGQVDIRDVVGSIRRPTLVLHRSGDRVMPVENGRWLAEHIPDARYVELPGDDQLWWIGDQDALLDEIQAFLGHRVSRHQPDRVLATVMFTDIVGSTALASRLGDRGWRDVIARHDAAVRALLPRFGGAEVKTLGDGFLATFDGPARAIRCAGAIHGAARDLGMEVRVGLHTGEVELVPGDVHGIAVAIGARVAAGAAAGETLVTRTVRDLVAGSGIEFDARGARDLKGVAGIWEVYAVARDERAAAGSPGVGSAPSP